jgi:type VI secretion system protein ImpA
LFDLDAWLSPLDGGTPSGEDLRNDPRFHELERLMEPRVEVVRDERNNPISQTRIPVDWSAVLAGAEELRKDGRDLRLLVIVARALANERGLAGLADGLTLIARTIEDHWDGVHPELRAGAPPREAALRRINALLQLDNDKAGLIADLAGTVFLSPRGIGPITGRELERGTLDARALLADSPGLTEAERAARIAEHEQMLNRLRAGLAATADQAPAELGAFLEAARAAAAALGEVLAAINARLEGASTVALPRLDSLLGRMIATLERAAPATAPTVSDPAPPSSGPEQHPATAMQSAAGASPRPIPDMLTSREDVIRCLDRVIAFYDRTEPSSPIPHLVRRIRRMVPMDFVALMEELAPAGLKEFRLLAGMPDDKKTSSREGDRK